MRSRMVAMISAMLLMTGCQSLKLESPLPKGGPTIWETIATIGHRADHQRGRIESGLPGREDGLYGYTRDAYNELDVRFPRLPNPTIIMYVFPHLSKEDTPVPGYSTMFQLYERPHYALPGELR